jgi:hypothetical protein
MITVFYFVYKVVTKVRYFVFFVPFSSFHLPILLKLTHIQSRIVIFGGVFLKTTSGAVTLLSIIEKGYSFLLSTLC